jgi:glycosyltransferase involved in cell wall biosynthesis
MTSPTLRVLMISDVYFPRVNGVSTSIETFRSDLADLGIEVRLVAPEYPTPHPSPSIWRIPSRRVPFDPEDRLMRWQPLRRRVDALAAEGADVIHIQTPFMAHYAAVRAARRHHLPVMTTYHTHFEEYIGHYMPVMPRPLLRSLARGLARSQCNGLDAVVVPSLAMRDKLSGYGVTAPMYVLPTGIPAGHFDCGRSERFRLRYDIAPTRHVALFVGRVAHEKNIGFLLDALSHALREDDVLLVVAGEGPALPELRSRVARLGLGRHVLFVGYLDRRHELPDCYAGADVFIFASHTETQGLVLLEAMAAGLPVYGLARMGTRDIIEPGRGAIAAPGDAQGFGRGLAALLLDPLRRATMAAEARRFAAEWSSVERAGQMARLYRSVVSA